jgi:hypothetical protein
MSKWLIITISGVKWEVATSYYAPVSIGGAAATSKEMGCELPTPTMVDAIWKAATWCLDPLPRRHNGTIQEMATAAVYADQDQRIAEQMAEAGVDPDVLLVAGTHKDIVRCPNTGRLGIYGWHSVTGKPIQPAFYGHSLDWIDYSQGLRLCRRAA